MRAITNDFKDEIKKFGRQITAKVVYYPNYNLITENDLNIIAENDLQIISEQSDFSNPIEIDNEDIVSYSIVKNGDLLKSLMKELNIETKIELNIGSVVNAQFGLLVNNNYEYVDFGNYIVKSKEYNMDTETWNYVCYDKMLFSMIKYTELKKPAFPMTLKTYITALAERIGLDFSNEEFVNEDILINEDLYKNRGLTYRDIFDDISQVVAGNLMIDDNDILVVGYPNETNDTINEEYLKDTNVKFKEKIGVINSVAIIDEENNIEYKKEDAQSIKENQMTKITITNNLIALNSDSNEIVNNVFDKLFGLYYYANDIATTGVCYYDFLDLFNVEFKGNNYKCLLLNNEITITQGIDEKIFTEKFEEVNTSYGNYVTSTPSNKQVHFMINEQEKKIEQSVKQDELVASLNLAIEDGQGVVRLVGNTVTIDSDKFKLAEDGSVNISNGAVEINDRGIQMGNGTNIVGGNGMLTQFHYSSYGKVGFPEFEQWRNAVYLSVYIPENFLITNAKIIIAHNPGQSYTYNPSTGTRTYYNCYVRNARLYYTTQKQKGDGQSVLMEIAPTTAGTVISTIDDSSDSKTFSSSTTEVVELELDTSVFRKGNQFLYIADYVDSIPSSSDSTGAISKSAFVSLDLFISGYISS